LENQIRRIYALFMRFDIRVILIFALYPLRTTLLEQTVTFVSKSFKIAKLHYLTTQNIFFIQNYNFVILQFCNFAISKRLKNECFCLAQEDS